MNVKDASTTPAPPDTLSGMLRARIRKSGLTPYAVAKAAGIAPSVVTRFLKGQRQLSLTTATGSRTPSGWS